MFLGIVLAVVVVICLLMVLGGDSAKALVSIVFVAVGIIIAMAYFGVLGLVGVVVMILVVALLNGGNNGQ